MSAHLIVDIGANSQAIRSLPGGVVLSPSGMLAGLSGVLVGNIADLRDSDANCNVYVNGISVTSGPLRIGVQTSDATTSGGFTDPTSGLVQMPGTFSSGGWLVIGQSGTNPGIFNAGNGVSGEFLISGFAAFAHFQRPHRYARLLFGSGFYDGPIEAGFISQLKTVGSGAGFTLLPGSGSINV